MRPIYYTKTHCCESLSSSWLLALTTLILWLLLLLEATLEVLSREGLWLCCHGCLEWQCLSFVVILTLGGERAKDCTVANQTARAQVSSQWARCSSGPVHV